MLKKSVDTLLLIVVLFYTYYNVPRKNVGLIDEKIEMTWVILINKVHMDLLPLDVHVCLNLDESVDKEIVMKCIKVYFAANHRNYKVMRLDEFTSTLVCDGEDIIRSGLTCFNEMFEKLKLKNSYETWFLYVSTGSIRKIYDKVTLCLLNKSQRNECSYAINKNMLSINNNMSKENKLASLKILNATLNELFNKPRTIQY
jgi:hypothetical protein